MTKAVGLDAIEIDRVAEAIERHGERFLARVYTAEERRVAEGSREASAQFYAGRFAAKEAVLKALGTGYAEGLGFHEVEILRDPNGAPRVALHGVAKERAATLGITQILVSITHTRANAHAVAVAE
jgi:holo-[acyl-carrier protein] synthase